VTDILVMRIVAACSTLSTLCSYPTLGRLILHKPHILDIPSRTDDSQSLQNYQHLCAGMGLWAAGRASSHRYSPLCT